MKRFAFLSLALLGVGLALSWWLQSPVLPEVAAVLPRTTTQLPSALPAAGPLPVAEAALPRSDSPLLPEAIAATPVEAVASLEQAREQGDARMPPVRRDAAPADLPSAAELADPKAYQQYEARQNQRVYRAYLQAADSEIPRLQDDIARARATGLSPEELAQGEEKLRRIQAMRDQLAADHPVL